MVVKSITSKSTMDAQRALKKNALMLHAVGLVKNWGLIIILLALTTSIKAQGDYFTRLAVNKKTVIAGDAFYVKISVYTKTWFTKAPNFGDYQVANSFTLRTDRPLSTFETFNGTRYTALVYEYIVFPLKPGVLELPALSVSFESPKEGDYKGNPVNISTNKATITVEDIPKRHDSLPLFVANSANIKESWSKSLSNLKTGDVLIRTINISVNGCLANVIPPLAFDSLPWASRYTAAPKLSQNVSNKAVSAVRTETHTYLLEQSGNFTFPEIKMNYYNLRNRKWTSTSIKEQQISIADNPDLQVLKTLQDSLAQTDQIYANEDRKELLLWGMKPGKFTIYLVTLSLVLFIFIVLAKKLLRKIVKWKEDYLVSESYQFKLLLKCIKLNNPLEVNKQVYTWLNKLQTEKKITTVADLAEVTSLPELKSNYNNFQRSVFGLTKENWDKTNELQTQFVLARKQIRLKA